MTAKKSPPVGCRRHHNYTRQCYRQHQHQNHRRCLARTSSLQLTTDRSRYTPTSITIAPTSQGAQLHRVAGSIGRLLDKGMGAEFLNLRVFFDINFFRHHRLLQLHHHLIKRQHTTCQGVLITPLSRTTDVHVCSTDGKNYLPRSVHLFHLVLT